MEVKVSNISKLAPKETLRTLFSILGNVLVFEHYPNLIKRDGSYQCEVVYANISEARRAVKLDGTELGDRKFSVTLEVAGGRFAAQELSERVKGNLREEEAKTAVVTGSVEHTFLSPDLQLPLFGESERVEEKEGEKEEESERGKETDAKHPVEISSSVLDKIHLKTNDPQQSMFLVEFIDRSTMLKTIEGAQRSQSDGIKFDEAWRCIDPNFNTLKTGNVYLYGVPADKLLKPRQFMESPPPPPSQRKTVTTATTSTSPTRSLGRPSSTPSSSHRPHDNRRRHRSSRSPSPHRRGGEEQQDHRHRSKHSRSSHHHHRHHRSRSKTRSRSRSRSRHTSSSRDRRRHSHRH